MAQKLEFEIDEKGHVTMHIKSVKGQKCVDIAREFGRVVGKVEKRRKTREYYEKPLKEKVRRG